MNFVAGGKKELDAKNDRKRSYADGVTYNGSRRKRPVDSKINTRK